MIQASGHCTGRKYWPREAKEFTSGFLVTQVPLNPRVQCLQAGALVIAYVHLHDILRT